MMTPGSIRVGDQLPSVSRAADLPSWNRYAAVNDEFVPIHMDDEAGRAAGFPSAIGMGNLQWSYLHMLLRSWIGDDGEILSLRCEFRAPSTRGTMVTARGTVRALRHEAVSLLAEVDVWTEADDGVILAPGSATVRLPH